MSIYKDVRRAQSPTVHSKEMTPMLKKILIAVAVTGLVIWLGVPVLLQALGLHPECPPFEGDLAGRSALVISTSHADMCGEKGGQIICNGTPEEIVKCKESFTGKYLKRELV